MDLESYLMRLSGNLGAVCELASDVDGVLACWKPAPTQWSILEVINHLADEERADFRPRVDLLLHHPGQPWVPIDPEGWVRDRAYNARDLKKSVDDFAGERHASLEWLRGLRDPQWNHTYEHPAAGAVTAEVLLASWVAHDLLHIRQLARLHVQYLNRGLSPYSTSYAGDLP